MHCLFMSYSIRGHVLTLLYCYPLIFIGLYFGDIEFTEKNFDKILPEGVLNSCLFFLYARNLRYIGGRCDDNKVTIISNKYD